MTIKTLRSGALYFREERLGFSHREVSTHSLRSEFYIELFLSRVYPETIMIIGRCSKNSFLRYIQIRFRNLRKFISDLMAGEKAFCTIPEA